MRYLLPTTLNAALDEMAQRPLTVMAGGTDVYPALRDRPLDRDTLDIGRIEGLRSIAQDGEGWRIGAGSTWTDLISTPLPAAFDGLKLAAREVGSLQIQNTGTLVGNLCNASPAADGVPCLLALNAEVELRSSQGVRILRLRDFITGVRETTRRNDELVTAILIPSQPHHARSGFLKLGARKYLVISIAMVSCVVAADAGVLSHVRIAVGSCSPVAERLEKLEAALTGRPPDAVGTFEITREHLAPLSAIDDVRGSASYRMEAVAELIRRTLHQTMPAQVAA